MIGRLSIHPSLLMKEVKENSLSCDWFNVFIHLTRFEVSAPGPLQSTSA